MDMLWSISGWVLWGLIALLSAGLLFSGNRDGGVRFILRTQGLVLGLGLAATLAFPISKFHLLWIFPVAFVTPMVIMQIRVANAMRHAESITSQQCIQENATPTESLDSLQEKLAEANRELELLENPETIFAFGQMSYDGDEVPQNYAEAAGWWKIAAEQGHMASAHNLGLMYEEGKGVSRDFAEAAKWFQKAAERGHAGSQNNLGILFETGDGVVKNYAAAIEWYRRAAEGGDANGRSSFKRLKAQIELEQYQNIIFEFSDLMAAQSPLIGDCSHLPHPKATILYAIKFVANDYETKRELETDLAIIDSYDKLISSLNYLFTCLARDWQEIDPEDKEKIASLIGHNSFPDWALPLKYKYIDEERAIKQATSIAFQVLSDRIEREKADKC